MLESANFMNALRTEESGRPADESGNPDEIWRIANARYFAEIAEVLRTKALFRQHRPARILAHRMHVRDAVDSRFSLRRRMVRRVIKWSPMAGENGKRKAAAPTRREVAVANAIGQAVSEHLNAQFSGVTSELGKITAGIGELKSGLDDVRSGLDGVRSGLDDVKSGLGQVKSELREIKVELGGHGKKLDQLIAGTVGIGRMTKLEERVTALEQRRPPPGD